MRSQNATLVSLVFLFRALSNKSSAYSSKTAKTNHTTVLGLCFLICEHTVVEEKDNTYLCHFTFVTPIAESQAPSGEKRLSSNKMYAVLHDVRKGFLTRRR